MMATTLPRPVLPVWARPPIDAEGDRAPGLDTIAPGQMNGGTRGDRLRADLLPQALVCRNAVAGLATTPTSRRLLRQADRLARKITDPAWAPDILDSEIAELEDLLANLRVLVAARAARPGFTKHAAAVQLLGLVRAQQLAKWLALPPVLPTPPRRRAALASSLSRSGPPTLFRGVASKAARNDAQTVMTT